MGPLKRVRFALSPFFCACALFVAACAQLSLSIAIAQVPTQQRVYGSAPVTANTSALAGFSKDSTTGVLTGLPGAPFADRLEGGLVAIDGQGRFLFVLNQISDNISMYQIDGSTGALTEVPNSPFAAGAVAPNMAPSKPTSLATEPSGNFLYVGYASGESTSTSALVPFSIDAANLTIVLTAQLILDFSNGAPIQMLTDPKGLRLYVGFGAGNQPSPAAGTIVYSIDATSGVLTQLGNAGGGSENGRAIAMDARGRFFFDAWGQFEGFLDSGILSPVDGTSGATQTINLGVDVFASSLLTESSGKFLYAQTGNGLLIYSIDQTTGALTLANGPLAAFGFFKGTTAADPMGPYIYSFGRAGVDVFQVDPQTGNLAEIPGAPFGIGGGLGLAISGTPTQNVSGPAVELFPSSTDLGTASVGQTTSTKIVSLVNTGNQILAVNGISITGANAGDFAKSSTCGATLAVNANCSISVLFTPSQAGAEQALVQVTDNAPGSPHTAAISGTGIAATPNVAIAPGSVDFGTVLQGAAAAPQTIQIMNSGTSALHISAVALSGSNPGDFSQTNTCVGVAVAVGQGCSITVSFSPKTEGQRTASLVLTDDAPNSPQSIALSGTATAPSVMVSPASVDFGSIAEGSTAAPQTVKITNSGSGSLHVTAVTLSGANPVDFSQTNTCVGTVVAGGSCGITVNFSPQTQGQRTASVAVSDDAGSSPQSIALTGTLASPFQLAATAGSSTTAMVSAGQTANYALQLTPGPGFSGTVAFSCSGAPLEATCNVAPVSMAVSGANAAPFQVVVRTSGNGFLVPVNIPKPRIRIWGTPVAVLILMWMAAWYAQRKQLRVRVGAFQLGSLMLILGLALIVTGGCGGGSSSTVNPIVTPSGTTILTVSAKSGTLTPQAIQLTLTVQ